ncbi:vWA domain-containing protein [Methylibium sp.]|uniref:vWA domain-containing protein n=1 Tax=Methylibium sp. TaxID=2067992 RepID=UPI003D14F4CF
MNVGPLRSRWQALWQALRVGRARAWLTVAALALAVTFVSPHLTWPQAQSDLVIVLDVTQSMEVADQQHDGQAVTRLAQVKRALGTVLRELPCGSRVGWGLFTEYRSFLLMVPVEVCENQRELLAVLSNIDGRMAWTGNSEIAKGLYSGLKIVKALPTKPALVFVTDGQEAPPVNPQYRPSDEGVVRVAPGLVVGVGGLLPVRIPKHDLQGRSYGYWGADEVMQLDPRSYGRGGSVAGEQMVDDGSERPGALVGATPGSEHLSSLREPYLQLLAGETGLMYQRLTTPRALQAAMTSERLVHPVPSRMDLRWVFGLLGLIALVGIYLPRNAFAGARLTRAARRGRARSGRKDRSTRSSPRPGS